MPLLNNFGFGIVGGKEIDGYVLMIHGTKYKLKLWNFDLQLRCDAAIKIDGKELGIWRIEKNQSIELERPENDRGCFTFYKAGTVEAVQSGLEVGDELGLIEVTFCPEKAPVPKPFVPQQPSAMDFWEKDEDLESLRRQIDSPSPGGTGLSGYSQDEYVSAGEIDHDYSKTTTIYVRLIAKADEPRPLLGKTFFSTVIPDPIH